MHGLRAKLPDTTVVLGGKHVTHNWQAVAQDCADADAIVRGDGESAIITLANALSTGADRRDLIAALGGLPNVWTSEKTSPPALPRPFDLSQAAQWPFEAITHGLDYYLGDRMIVEYSRGCPGRCSYCLASRGRSRLSYRPVAQVVDSISYLASRGFSSFFFTDDDFAASPQHLKRICEALIARELTIEFDANVRPDSLVRCTELSGLLRRAGCRCLWLGIESGSDEILKSYNKGFSSQLCERAVEVAMSAAEVVRTNWIIGAPIESENTIRASMSLARRLRDIGPHVPHVSFLIPYPGTPICDEALKLGLIRVEDLAEIAGTTHEEPSMPSRYLSKAHLKNLFTEFHVGYYDDGFFRYAPPAVDAEARLVLQSARMVRDLTGASIGDLLGHCLGDSVSCGGSHEGGIHGVE